MKLALLLSTVLAVAFGANQLSPQQQHEEDLDALEMNPDPQRRLLRTGLDLVDDTPKGAIVDGYLDLYDRETVQKLVRSIDTDIKSLMREEGFSVGDADAIIVTRAQSQVVAGTNYIFTMNVGSFEDISVAFFVALPANDPSQSPQDLTLVDLDGGSVDFSQRNIASSRATNDDATYDDVAYAQRGGDKKDEYKKKWNNNKDSWKNNLGKNQGKYDDTQKTFSKGWWYNKTDDYMKNDTAQTLKGTVGVDNLDEPDYHWPTFNEWPTFNYDRSGSCTGSSCTSYYFSDIDHFGYVDAHCQSWKTEKWNEMDAKGGFHPHAKCHCYSCQRECALDEVFGLDACDIDDIPAIKFNAADAQISALGQAIRETAEMFNPFPGVDQVSGLINIGANYFKAVKNEYTVLAAVIDEVNDRVEQLQDCMDQKIAMLKAENIQNDFGVGFTKYGYVFEHTASPRADETRRGLLYSAFTNGFETIINKLADDDDATFYANLLMPLQDFALLYSHLAAEYLLILRTACDCNFLTKVNYAIEAFQFMHDWLFRAKDTMWNDLVTKLLKLPCYNSNTIMGEMLSWSMKFGHANIDPINAYITNMEKLRDTYGPFYKVCNDTFSDMHLCDPTEPDEWHFPEEESVFPLTRADDVLNSASVLGEEKAKYKRLIRKQLDEENDAGTDEEMNAELADGADSLMSASDTDVESDVIDALRKAGRGKRYGMTEREIGYQIVEGLESLIAADDKE